MALPVGPTKLPMQRPPQPPPQPPLPFAPPTCGVCGEARCADLACRHVAAQQPKMEPFAWRNFVAFQGRLIRERRARDRGRKANQQRIEAMEAAESAALLERYRREHPELPAEQVRVVDLPSGLSQLAPLPPERIARFRRRLELLIARAQRYANADAVPPDQHHRARARSLQGEALLAQQPALKRACEQLCGACRGACCTEGGDHAYLTTAILRRELDRAPHLTAEELRDRYLAQLPAASIVGSCLYQSATGCTLPREQRADLCNAYFCEPLLALQRDGAAALPQQLLLVLRANHQWNRFDTTAHNAVVRVAPLALAPPPIAPRERVQSPPLGTS